APPLSAHALSLHDALPILERPMLPTAPPSKVRLPLVRFLFTAKEAVWKVLSCRAWRRVDCIDSSVLVMAVRPLSAASSVWMPLRSEEHTSELQSRENLVCR